MAPRGNGTRLEWLSLPLLLLIWQVAAMVAASRFLPSPLVVAGEIADLVVRGHMLADFGQTLSRAVAGFVSAMLLGGVLGFLLGRINTLDRLFGPWVLVGLNLPAIVLFSVGLISGQAATDCLFITLGLTLYYRFYIAQTALEVGWSLAMALSILQLLLTILFAVAVRNGAGLWLPS